MQNKNKNLTSQLTLVTDVASRHVTVAPCFMFLILRGCQSIRYVHLSEKPCLKLFLWALPRQCFLLEEFKLCKDEHIFKDCTEI